MLLALIVALLSLPSSSSSLSPPSSLFGSFPAAAEDAVFAVTRRWGSFPRFPDSRSSRASNSARSRPLARFNECPLPGKVSCGVGAYRDEQGRPFVLPSVASARAALAALPAGGWTHEYQPIGGPPAFAEAAQGLAFGPLLAGLAPRGPPPSLPPPG